MKKLTLSGVLLHAVPNDLYFVVLRPFSLCCCNHCALPVFAKSYNFSNPPLIHQSTALLMARRIMIMVVAMFMVFYGFTPQVRPTDLAS